MRKIRSSAINRSRVTDDSDTDLKGAIKGKQANLLGKNGLSHNQDMYLALAKTGDVVLPLGELSNSVIDKLRSKFGNLENLTVGNGRELTLDEHVRDGLVLAELGHIEQISTMLSSNSKANLANVGLSIATPLRPQLKEFIQGNASRLSIVSKLNGQFSGVLLCKIENNEVNHQKMIKGLLAYSHFNFEGCVDLLRALDVWAKAENLASAKLAARKTTWQREIEATFERAGYVQNGEFFRKSFDCLD